MLKDKYFVLQIFSMTYERNIVRTPTAHESHVKKYFFLAKECKINQGGRRKLSKTSKGLN